jgi:hypothetical protein
MRRGHFPGAGFWLALAIMVVGAQAQAQQPAKPAVPKAGADFSGVWLLSGGGGGGGNAFNKRPQSEWTDQALPFTPAGQKVFETNKPGKGPRMVKPVFGNDPIGGANPPGLYRTLVYSRPIEIEQLPGKIVQLFGWGRVFRIIYADGRPVPDDVPQGPFWYGYSVGRWEGDTLVVNTLALDGRAWFDEWGTPISDDAKIEERWQRVAPDRLQLKIAVTDPAFYSRPWTSAVINYSLQHNVEPEEIIFSPMDENAFNKAIRDPAGLPKQ